MTGLEEEAPANSVPAAAVRRGGQVFFGMTGRKGHVGGVKSADLRRNAKSEGSSLGPYRRWSAKAWGANGIRYPGAAWLSSARVVRCLVKSYNERNPRFVLLRHAPKEKVFATEVSRGADFWPSLAGDDDVELAAEKDSAFRRAARWCGT
ncbi:unnamed protein product [Vicia faba]|uniref:Uncharacterized protein n=1 Tax=Vicia faba TaxID=3906 RepID=A0AAV1A2M3_VICFA|nr:unnamed protein product [Vicia faba]